MRIKTEKDFDAHRQSGPFVPPEGDVCFADKLSPELLCHIFMLGGMDEGEVEPVDLRDYWPSVVSGGGEGDRESGSEIENKSDDDEGKDGREDESERQEESESEEEDEESGDETEGEPEAEEDNEESEEDGEWNEASEADDEHHGDDESDSSAGTTPSHSYLPFPFLVSHVCRHWRNVAVSNQSLWTDFEVCPAPDLSYELGAILLERSKNLPIDVRIDCQASEADGKIPSGADLRPLVSMLIPHIQRWRTMNISVLHYHLMHVFLRAASDPSTPAASQLTRLELYHDGGWASGEYDTFDSFASPRLSNHFTLFGGSAPCLTTLVLWGVHVDWNQPWIASASNLRNLKLAFHAEDVRPSCAEFVTILRGASSLKRLDLHRSGPSGNPVDWFLAQCSGSLASPFQFPQVTSLVLTDHSEVRAMGLIREFYFPALENMVLEFHDANYDGLIYELVSPATSALSSAPGSRCSILRKLKRLKIVGLPCDIGCVEMLYRELENLTTLTIVLEHLHSLFLNILGCSRRSSGRRNVCLPRLVTLYVSGASGNALRKVVQTRKDAGVPLSSLYVKKYSRVSEKEEKWFRKNVETFEFCNSF